jgi:predicted nucleic acid-binding protein
MNLVDSSGWIEYLQDTPRADLFAAAIEDRHQLLVPTIALFEVHKILSRILPEDLIERCLDVMRMGRVLDLSDQRAIAASQVASRYRLAMADAAMYSMAREFEAEFWTQDVDYQGLPGVQYAPKSGPVTA